MNDLFPYDINELVGSAARILIAPTTVAAPVGLHEVVEVIGAPSSPKYPPQTGWLDLGATTTEPQYTRNLTVKERTIQQENTGLLRRPDQITRGVSMVLGEVSQQNLAIFEPGSTSEDIAAAVGHAAYDHTNIGTATSLVAYRLAVIGLLDPRQGIVTEGVAGPTRGRLVGRIFPLVQIDADNASATLGEDGWTLPVNLTSFPDPDVDGDVGEGFWFSEKSGVIAIV